MIFFNNNNNEKEYVVVTDLTSVFVVKDFAKRHCTDEHEIDIHVHGSLLEDKNLVTIKFKSSDEETLINSDFIAEFWENYKLAIRRKTIFVFKKEESE